MSSTAKLVTDSGGHQALKEGSLSEAACPGFVASSASSSSSMALPTCPAPMPLTYAGLGVPSNGSAYGVGAVPICMGPTSSNGFPSPASGPHFGDASSAGSVFGDESGCSESQTKELAWKVKKGENSVKLGLQQMGLMQGSAQDLSGY